MTPTKVLIGQMLVVFGIALAGTWAATQWVAFELGFQRRLGEPWFSIDNLPVYYPWRLFEWWYVYDAYAPDVFQTGVRSLAAAASLPLYPPFSVPSGEPGSRSSSPPMAPPAGPIRRTSRRRA